jgi:hypothetical protein
MIRENYPTTLISINDTTGTSGSPIYTLGVVDFSTIIAKVYATSMSGTSPTLDVYLQTQDPSTASWFDLVHFAQIVGTVTEANALFAAIGKGNGYLGTAPSVSLAAGKASSIPLLSRAIRVVYTYGGTIGTVNATISLSAVDQDYR